MVKWFKNIKILLYFSEGVNWYKYVDDWNFVFMIALVDIIF